MQFKIIVIKNLLTNPISFLLDWTLRKLTATILVFYRPSKFLTCTIFVFPCNQNFPKLHWLTKKCKRQWKKPVESEMEKQRLHNWWNYKKATKLKYFAWRNSSTASNILLLHTNESRCSLYHFDECVVERIWWWGIPKRDQKKGRESGIEISRICLFSIEQTEPTFNS